MKFSKVSLFLAVALLGSLVLVSAQDASGFEPEPKADDLIKLVELAGPDKEYTPFEFPDGFNHSLILGADKVTLFRLPAANATNNGRASAVFQYIATRDFIVWKLTLRRVANFTGAHLYLDLAGNATDPIVQHLIPPESAPADFIPPVNIPVERVITGSFGIEELEDTLGVTSIAQFLAEFVARNLIYVQVHGPGTVTILRGFLNV